MAALPVRRSPSRRSPSAVASQRGRGREKEAEVDLDGCHAGKRECSRFLCRDSIVGAVGRPIHPSGGNVRGARGCHSRRRTKTMSATTARGGGVCWLSRPHLPRKPPNSTDKVSPHSAHRHRRRRPPIDLPRSLPFSHSFSSFQTRRAYRRRRWRRHRIRLQTAGRTSLSPFNHRARSLGHGCIRIGRRGEGDTTVTGKEGRFVA